MAIEFQIKLKNPQDQELGLGEQGMEDFIDDEGNQSGFSALYSSTLGVTKRASIPLAATESRW